MFRESHHSLRFNGRGAEPTRQRITGSKDRDRDAAIDKLLGKKK